MNWDRVEGKWKQFRGRVKEKWGNFTDDQWDVVDGQRDQRAGSIQESYGICADRLERTLRDWKNRDIRSQHIN